MVALIFSVLTQFSDLPSFTCRSVQPAACMWLRMAVSEAQCKIVNLLQTFWDFFFWWLHVTMCMWPKTTLLPAKPGDAKSLDTPEGGKEMLVIPKYYEMHTILRNATTKKACLTVTMIRMMMMMMMIMMEHFWKLYHWKSSYSWNIASIMASICHGKLCQMWHLL